MFCGIDLGTSSVKAAIFLPDGKMVAYSRKECDMVSPRVGCTCQQKLDTKLKKSGIKNESMYKIHQLF